MTKTTRQPSRSLAAAERSDWKKENYGFRRARQNRAWSRWSNPPVEARSIIATIFLSDAPHPNPGELNEENSMNDEDDSGAQYQVVVNAEEQYSIWPLGRELP